MQRKIRVDNSDERHVRKCKPLAIICVPTRISILPARKLLKVSIRFFARHQSASIRRTVALGKICATVDSTFSVPKP
jgi:hypothetical protein